MPLQELGLAGVRREDTRPAAEQNNVWYSYRSGERCLVFVHGLGDDSRNCWYQEESSSYWPERVANSEEFHDYSIFLGGYYTSKILSGNYGLSDCANELFGALETPKDRRRAVLDHSAIVFVCHSLGGIVTRYLLDHHKERFQDRSVGLLLIASPSAGSKWADWVAYLADACGNDAVRTLRTDSDLLGDLDERFRDLVNDRKIPRLHGVEACETKAFKGVLPKVVSEQSAGQYFGKITKLAKTDHSSCVKPDHDNHPTHSLLLRFVNTFEKKFAKNLPERQPPGLICRRLRWSLVLNEDGDAREEINLEGITSAGAESFYEVSDDWHNSGYVMPPQLVTERTSPTASFGSLNGKQGLVFAPVPTIKQPAGASYQQISYNVYSMDARELRLKEKRSDAIVDFIQKTLTRERVDQLVMQVQFPETIRLSGDPYVRVLQVNSETDDSKASLTVARMVDYSPMLRVATLFVDEPPPDRDYRLCWRLDEPKVPAPEPNQEVRDKHDEVVARLLKLRSAMSEEGGSNEHSERLRQLQELMAQCGGLVAKKVKPRIDLRQLEISLMVLDDQDASRSPVLRIVHGTDLSEESWIFELRAGDGNAGRAVKKCESRFYDAQAAMRDPFRYVYRSIGTRQHEWLMSTPLFDAPSMICGVLNVGTFDKRTARALRPLESMKDLPDEIHQLLLPALLSDSL
jgi:hypothetical protein